MLDSVGAKHTRAGRFTNAHLVLVHDTVGSLNELEGVVYLWDAAYGLVCRLIAHGKICGDLDAVTRLANKARVIFVVVKYIATSARGMVGGGHEYEPGIGAALPVVLRL